MLEVRPFRGLRYNLNKIDDPSSVICPPYDVISPEEQQGYQRRNPFNIIGMELGEEKPDDSPEQNKYTRAAAILDNWLAQGVLMQDANPAFYVFEHRFDHDGKTLSRWGLSAAVRLEDWSTGNIRPHEAILKNPVGDRLRLMRSCNTNLSPIMGLLPFENNGMLSLMQSQSDVTPSMTATTDDGVVHNMWVVTEEGLVNTIREVCAGTVMYIADGHHRYQTSLLYQQERRDSASQYSGEEAFNFTMVTLMDAADPGIRVLPIHRMVRIAEPSIMATARERLDELFHLEQLPPVGSTPKKTIDMWGETMQQRDPEGVVAGCYGLHEKNLCLLTPCQKDVILDMLPEGHSPAWGELKVSQLHWAILQKVFSMNNPSGDSGQIEYTKSATEAINRVDSGEFQLAFLLNRLPVSSILDIADAKDRMPQKCTYFYPKVPTGLVIHSLQGDED